jgi:hypothetical protein
MRCAFPPYAATPFSYARPAIGRSGFLPSEHLPSFCDAPFPENAYRIFSHEKNHSPTTAWLIFPAPLPIGIAFAEEGLIAQQFNRG